MKRINLLSEYRRAVRLFSIIGLTLLSFTSCGLIDFELGEDGSMENFTMRLNRDTVYVMEGDTFRLQPEFTTELLANDAVYWHASDSGIVAFEDGVFKIMTAGELYVSATTVHNNETDSCYVIALKRWAVTNRDYPSDMVVMAQVELPDRAFNPETVMVGAFLGDQCCGVGEMKEFFGIRYVQIRIWSDIPQDAYAENNVVQFRYYDRERFISDYFDQTLIYDGETHGDLTHLFRLSVAEK